MPDCVFERGLATVGGCVCVCVCARKSEIGLRTDHTCTLCTIVFSAVQVNKIRNKILQDFSP